MNTLRKLLVMASFMLVVAAFIPAAKADDGDWATQVNINEPMQVGNLVLAPGSYVFRLVDIWAPDVVSIYNASTEQYDGFIMGTPVFREHATEHSTFNLERIGKGAPEALRSWFYPDTNYGIAFPVSHVKTAKSAGTTVNTAELR